VLMLFGRQIKAHDFAIACALFFGICISLYQWQSVNHLAAVVTEKQLKFEEMKALAETIKRLPRVSISPQSQVTRDEVQRLFNRYGLKPDTLDTNTEGQVKVDLKQVSFNQLVKILPTFQRFLIAVENLTVEKTDREGWVNVELVLVRLR